MAGAKTQEEMFSGPEVASLQDSDVLASLSKYARAFGTDRETLRRCLLEAGVQPVAERAGHKLYSLRAVYQAWAVGDDGPVDPDKMKPFPRKAWLQGEAVKLDLMERRGRLVAAADVQRTIAALNQLYVRGLETTLDVIERDCGLTPQQAGRLERHIDQLREELYKAIAERHELRRALETAPADEDEDDAEDAAPAPAAAKPPRGAPASAVDEAVAFLREALAEGARPSADLIAEAKTIGISEATLRRARAQMGDELRARREGRGWAWELAQGARGA